MSCRTFFLRISFALILCLCGQVLLTAATPVNIIVMISDGWGENHILATNFWQHGQAEAQRYEAFPVDVMMSTFAADGNGYDWHSAWNYFHNVTQYVTDSAAAATAMASGVKTNSGKIGIDPEDNPVRLISEVALDMGKAAGVVTTVQFSHATPAAFVVHNHSRDNYGEIARSMLLDTRLRVVIGCGHPEYDNSGNRRSKPKYKYVGDEALWLGLVNGQTTFVLSDEPAPNQVEDIDNDGSPDAWKLITRHEDFVRIAGGQDVPKRLLGVPRANKTTQEERDGDPWAAPYIVPLNPEVPTLSEMSLAALRVLKQDADGFFLMIEGGAVDWASHNNYSGRMIEEMVDFNQAVDTVIDWIEQHGGWEENLLIVTGDHECGYLTGPGSGQFEDDSVWTMVENRGQGALPAMQWHSGHHTNQLIPLFAAGAGSHLLNDRADAIDPRKGRYLDNTDLGIVMIELWADCEEASVE